MSRYTVGSVPYINAIPLVRSFEVQGAASPVEVRYEVPSRLPSLLDSGVAQAVLVSSVDALRVPGRRMAAGVCIGSDGPVKSVRLFSKVPLESIRSLCLDSSSMTSNRLAQLLLRECHGIDPEVTPHAPDLDAMLETADACVLIGDIGMSAPEDGLHVWDLGDAWTQLTGLPFVWAAWIGSDALTPELVGLLQDAARKQEGSEAIESLVSLASTRTGLSRDRIDDYYRNVMAYRMDERMLEGLREFQRRLLANGFADCLHYPEIVDRR